MQLYTIGFTQRSAASFFGSLRQHGIRQLVDVRLNNVSQLAGFTKRDDLAFFLAELCQAGYLHEPLLAPTQQILDSYRSSKGKGWSEFERQFLALLEERGVERRLDPKLFETPTVLLCSEPKPEHCHRRIVAEYLQRKWGNLEIVHL